VTHTLTPRDQALQLLSRIDPAGYSKLRNFLSGPVTRLSPYLRHGILTLAEVRDHLRQITRNRPWEANRLLQELAWRDYFQRLHHLLGNQIWTDLEPLKTGLSPNDYGAEFPQDITQGNTGLACIDAFSHDLLSTGYLHNHARMYFAAYVVHHRRVSWQAGARFFLTHLLDGDEASNNLSWQWVASTFSAKPYFFNRENLAHYTENRYCPTCPAKDNCPFDASYEALAERLFPNSPGDQATPARVPLKVLPDEQPASPPTTNTIAWAHEDALSSAHPAYTGVPTLAILDTPHHHEKQYSPARIAFITAATRAVSPHYAEDDPAPLLLDFARRHNATHLRIPTTPSPRGRSLAQQLKPHLTIHFLPPEPFVTLTNPTDLSRFTRYWKTAEKALIAFASP
jgi:deoxyribodipyrimidine photo-lyase